MGAYEDLVEELARQLSAGKDRQSVSQALYNAGWRDHEIRKLLSEAERVMAEREKEVEDVVQQARKLPEDGARQAREAEAASAEKKPGEIRTKYVFFLVLALVIAFLVYKFVIEAGQPVAVGESAARQFISGPSSGEPAEAVAEEDAGTVPEPSPKSTPGGGTSAVPDSSTEEPPPAPGG